MTNFTYSHFHLLPFHLFPFHLFTYLSQVVTYTSANLLGDIGGVLGLFLGASVFTVIEFFQVFVFALQKHCFGKWCGEEETEKSEEDRQVELGEDKEDKEE